MTGASDCSPPTTTPSRCYRRRRPRRHSPGDFRLRSAVEPAGGQTGSFAGLWSSTYGRQLVLAQAGDEVSGSYDTDNGRVVFKVTGKRTLDGYWIEDASGVECGSAREGRNYWGRLVLEFGEALSGHVGSWSYCDAEPDRGWYGSRVGPG